MLIASPDMEWTESLKKVLQETAKTLKGTSRRRFMAQIVLELGHGAGQTHLNPVSLARQRFRFLATKLNNS